MSMEYPCIYFEKDGKCRKFSDENTTSYCVMGPCPEQKLSNADRIRAMTDEELAEWLTCPICKYASCKKTCPVILPNADPCEMQILGWLQQPAEDDT